MSKEVVEKILAKSGNSFHLKVSEALKELGWYVTVSQYYTDNFTDKPREIDILAEKQIPIYEYGQQQGVITVQIFIECKYQNSPTVLWFDDKNMEKAKQKAAKDAGLGNPKNSADVDRHHFCTTLPVVKLFASEKTSSEKEPFFTAINQSINALIHHRNFGITIPRDKQNGNNLRTLRYPIIVCNSFEQIFVSDDRKNEKPEQMFQIEVNYSYPEKGEAKNEYFIIDVINFKDLHLLLDLIEKTDVKISGMRALGTKD